ncbi:hypothetical protein [Liquorilactobacillus uvarum]|uniref:hypothetical protein n=1 Tax=Liquorilactobacillus uvarum TaxID=303240 RepID=UPI00288AAE73|nr:hypothetical protein [Liquorilactobacillus uvarum]
MFKFIAIVGTNASFSFYRFLVNYMRGRYREQTEIEIQEIKNIPLFNEDMVQLPPQINLPQILNVPRVMADTLPANEFMLGKAKNKLNQNEGLIHEQTIEFLDQCFAIYVNFINNRKLCLKKLMTKEEL